MESLRSSSQLKFFPETAVSWRRRWQKTQTSILWQKLATRDGALAVRSDRLNFQGLGLQGFRFFPVEDGLTHVDVDHLLHLRHQGSRGSVACVETTTEGCARGDRHLVSDQNGGFSLEKTFRKQW